MYRFYPRCFTDRVKLTTEWIYPTAYPRETCFTGYHGYKTTIKGKLSWNSGRNFAQNINLKIGEENKGDEHAESCEVWCYQRLTRTSWTVKVTSEQVQEN